MATKVKQEAPESEPENPTVTEWAMRRGMLPQYTGTHDTAFGAAPTLNPQYWKFAAASARCRWTGSERLPEADFDTAIHIATTAPL